MLTETFVDRVPGEGFDAVKGHITGAVNVPFLDLIDAETARFVAPDRMRARLEVVGLLERPHIITYCGGAIAATVDAFALALCGHDSVAVYDGSLMEWSADPELPMTDPSST